MLVKDAIRQMRIDNPELQYYEPPVPPPPPEQQPQEPGLLSRLGTAAISAIPGAYFFTEPGRKFVSDAAGAVKDYAVGAWQGGAEAMRTEQAINNMYTDQGSHVNPRWGGGELKPEYTQEDADQALAQQDKALQAFTRETLEPTAGIVGAVVAPEVAIPAMIAKQGIDTYQETNDTPVRKALNAMRGMTYGPIADIATDPQLAQKFEKNPARMTANIAMAAGQVLYPLGVMRRGVTSGIRKGNEVIADMNRELSEPIRYAQTHENVGYRDRGAQEINTPLVNETIANKSPVRSALREIRQQEEVPITFEQPKQELSAEFDDIFKNTPKVPVQEQKASPPVESIVVNGVRYTIPKVEGELDLNIFRGDDIPARYTVSDSADFVGTLPETQSRVESVIRAYNREFPDDPILITDGARPQNADYGSPTSYHKSGEAVDFTSPGLESDPVKRARLVELAQEHGFSEVLDEYSNPSAYATGGHVHMGGLGENRYTGEYVPREAFMEEVPRAREIAEVEPPAATEVAASVSPLRDALAEIRRESTAEQPVREDIQPALRGGKVQPSTGGDVADVTPVIQRFDDPNTIINKGKSLDEIEQEIASRTNQNIEPVAPAVGMSIKLTGKKPSTEEVSQVRFENPESELRWKSASEGIQKDTLPNRVKQTLITLKNQATRVYEHLPNGPEFAQLKFDLLRQEKQKGVVSDRTNKLIQGILLDVDKPGMDLFARKVILDDLAKTEGELPFGLTKETLPIEKAKVDATVTNNPKVARAVELRRQVWDGVKSEYVKAMADIGLDVSNRVSREDYFRHQVLDYANLKAVSGVGQKLKKPTNRGFLKVREGSARDINTNYLQAEFEVMAQMLHDVETAKTLKAVKNNYSIRDKLVEQYGDQWREHVPEGYTEWSPGADSSFGIAKTIPEKVATNVFGGILEEMGVPKERVNAAINQASPFKELVVKEEVAKTLDNLGGNHADGMVSKLSRMIVSGWKRWILSTPTRVAKFQLRNISGDTDAVLAMNPKSLRFVKQATNELYQNIYGNRGMPPEMREWFKRGGMETNLLVNELPDINKLDMFMKYAEKNPNAFKKLWNGYWGKVDKSNTLREGILRYANYLEYLDQMKQNGGKPRNFGASWQDEVMALKDVRDRAFKLSNDVLGAYDNISVLGREIREHLYPFWSFTESNFSRYKQFLKNQMTDEKIASAVGMKVLGIAARRSAIYAARAGVFAVKAGAVWSILQAYNYFVFPEEEKDLPVEERARPHIVLGRDANGKVRYFSRMGSFGDFLEWFGLDTPSKDISDFLDGSRTFKEILYDMAKNPLNKVVQGIAPTIKMPAELLTGKKLFPDALNPRTIKDRPQYIADSLALGNEFKAFSKSSLGKAIGVEPRPSKPYMNQDMAEGLVMYKAEPGASSYYTIQDKKRKYLDKIGKGGDGDFRSPKSDALRNYKIALRLKDIETARYYLEKYKGFGGNDKGLKRSLESLDPLAGLSKEDKSNFVKSLTEEDRRELSRAQQYYKTVMLGK